MHERIIYLRGLEPANSGRGSYQAILETAAGLFGQFPAQDITLRDILQTSGVSNQTLYNYFPEGRDDISIVLYDRFQRTVVHDFKNICHSAAWGEPEDDATTVKVLAASLVRACFSYLTQNYTLICSLYQYLSLHNLITVATHMDSLREAVDRELQQRFAGRIEAGDRTRIARLAAFLARGIAEQGMQEPDLPLEGLESNARLLLRSLIASGLPGSTSESGPHKVGSYTPAPIAVVPPRLSSQKKQSILERILKRKKHD